MKRLSEFAVNRDNNFNLIRLSAAIAVLFGHCFPLTTGKEANLWIGRHLGVSLGSMAVDIFFITSGYLVTGSLLSRKDVLKFICARILRVYPALIIMLILTLLFIGTYFTSLHTADYLTSHDTFRYLLKNGSLLTGASYTLPGVFDTNPYKGSVNGSLWTLPYEIWMYCTLILLWLLLSITSKLRLCIFKIAVVILTLFSVLVYISVRPNDTNYYQLIKLFSMFFTGATFCVMQERIMLSPQLFWLASMTLGISMIDKNIFHVVYSLNLPYLLIYIAYIPAGRIRSFNQVGDYSYGVYIYAFPIQQSIAALFPDISVVGMLTTSLFFTFIFAGLSWHLIEKPALSLKTGLLSRYNSRLN